jgi:hypothetical protein
MVALKSYRQFGIEIRPSLETNDHEVRFFGDGEDIIAQFWNDMIGLDPADILVNPSPLEAGVNSHKATVARCNCGVIGCGSIEVDIKRSAEFVEWSWGKAGALQALRFLASSYSGELRRALTDTSWETPDRTAARLLASQIDRQALAMHGLTFIWGSGRARKGAFSVSLRLEPGPYQILVNLPWHEESPEGIARKCAELLREQPSSWIGAEWFPQQAGLGPPRLAGTSWRRGGS